MLKVENLKVKQIKKDEMLSLVGGVSFRLRKGHTLGIVGESGAGKTMSALAITGLAPAGFQTSGSVLYHGEEILNNGAIASLRGKEIALMMQDPSSALNPSMTIEKQILECASGDSASKILKSVGISDVKSRLKSYPHQLSGGMRQRVLLAIALAGRPKILIADEPTTGLDATVSAQILELLEDIKNRFSLSTILITHDMGVVARLCDEVLVMYGGKAVEYGTVERIFYHSVHPYTKGLLNSISRLDGERRKRLRPLPGSATERAIQKDCCIFSSRCEVVKEICLSCEPEMKTIENQHNSACHLEGSC